MPRHAYTTVHSDRRVSKVPRCASLSPCSRSNGLIKSATSRACSGCQNTAAQIKSINPFVKYRNDYSSESCINSPTVLATET